MDAVHLLKEYDVQVVVSVQYQVMKNHMYDAFYRLTDSRSQITSYVFDVVRATVPTICLDDVFTTKDEIASGKSFLAYNDSDMADLWALTHRQSTNCDWHLNSKSLFDYNIEAKEPGLSLGSQHASQSPNESCEECLESER